MPHPDALRVPWFDESFALKSAWLCGGFSVLVALGVAWEGLSIRPMTYFDDPVFLAVQKELIENPGNPELTTRYRAEDAIRRSAYFRSRARIEAGSWMLLAGVSLCLLSVRRLVVLRQVDPVPLPPTTLQESSDLIGKAFAASVVIPIPAAAALIAAFLLYGGASSERLDFQEMLAGPPPEIPELERWTGFRGNNTLGSSPPAALPETWNAETGHNVVWKAPVPAAGASSPIVWGDRIFLTGSDGESRSLFCFDLSTGALIWECKAATPAYIDAETRKKAMSGDTGFAAPTPTTDGRLIYAFFGTNELIAVDFNGRQVWGKWLGKPNSFYGISTSPRYHQGKVILQHDQGDDEAPSSALIAFNAVDGSILWKTQRPVPGSWSSPIIVAASAGVQIIAAGKPWLAGYDPNTGKELWRASVLSGDVAPLPVFARGRAMIGVQYAKLSAVLIDGTGDVTSTHVDWTYDGDLPDVPSPVTDGTRLLVPTSSGGLACLRVEDGSVIWTGEVEGEFWSSPTLVGEDVYFTNSEGTTSIFKLGEEFLVKGTGTVGERVVTSPAVLQSHLILRGEKHLYLLGAEPWAPPLREPI